jgi:hypothetical protein
LVEFNIARLLLRLSGAVLLCQSLFQIPYRYACQYCKQQSSDEQHTTKSHHRNSYTEGLAWDDAGEVEDPAEEKDGSDGQENNPNTEHKFQYRTMLLGVRAGEVGRSVATITEGTSLKGTRVTWVNVMRRVHVMLAGVVVASMVGRTSMTVPHRDVCCSPGETSCVDRLKNFLQRSYGSNAPSDSVQKQDRDP